MPVIKIQEIEYSYGEAIEFAAGIIGFPEMRRAALVPMPNFEPFFWLASLDIEGTHFIVVDPREVFPDYRPQTPAELESVINSDKGIFVIVKISSNWKKTTVNLRAPIFLNNELKKGAQLILSDSEYRLDEPLPQN
ncbi:MAG: flagellar assembly protein FliW [Pyrinomonadaceae bacterium]|nr:flagellar assembly protein FliW [Pyrinomonadaceae bacterium]